MGVYIILGCDIGIFELMVGIGLYEVVVYGVLFFVVSLLELCGNNGFVIFCGWCCIIWVVIVIIVVGIDFGVRVVVDLG